MTDFQVSAARVDELCPDRRETGWGKAATSHEMPTAAVVPVRELRDGAWRDNQHQPDNSIGRESATAATTTTTEGPRVKSCVILDCDRTHHAKGLCLTHYEKARRGENPGLGDKMFGVFGRTKCEDCDQAPMAGGRWCLTHFQQFKARQDAERPERDRRRSKVACGTSDAAAKHRRKGEPLCPKCQTVGKDWLSRVAAA